MAADAAAGLLGIGLWTGDTIVDNALIMPAICYGRTGQAVVECFLDRRRRNRCPSSPDGPTAVESTATGTAG